MQHLCRTTNLVYRQVQTLSPFELGTKLVQDSEGTKPYFDRLFFEDDYMYGYAPRAVHWKPAALQKLIDVIFSHGAYKGMDPRKRIRMEEAIRRATNANQIGIYDCVNKNRDKFQPEEWDSMFYLRDLKGYLNPRELFFHRTQEEIDEEAEELEE